MGFRISPQTTIRIADLKSRDMEEVARRYDTGDKGYLTLNEAYALFADHNDDVLPSSLKDVVEFLGGKQHNVTVHHQGWGEVMALPWHAHDWKGDFSVPGFGAGNVRVGGLHNWEREQGQKAAVFLFDCNLVDLHKLDKELVSATLVVGPAGFSPEDGASLGEAVELPLTLATQEAHETWTRAGNQWVPERKYLAAAVDVEDLKKLANENGLSFYARIETVHGTQWINKDGVPGRNFDVSNDELNRYSGNG